jgi:hypothetical protein
MRIRLEHPRLARERRHQHQQRRFRQVEVGQQRIDRTDAITGKDEDLRLARERQQFAIVPGPAVAPGTLQCAHHGGADGDDASTGRARAADLFDQLGADVEPLAVHAMLAHVVDAYRLESAGADMQGDVAELHATRAQRIQQRIVEMQSRGRRRDGADLAREHGLVAFVVVGARLAVDVRRQRQAAGVQQP